MAFIRVPTRLEQKTLTSVVVATHRDGIGADGSSHPRFRIVLGNVIAADKGWTAATRLAIRWGAGDDFGWLQLKPAKDGLKLRQRQQSLVMVFHTLPLGALTDRHGNRWRFVPEVRPATTTSYRDLPDDSLAVQLPLSWFEQIAAARPRRTLFNAA